MLIRRLILISLLLALAFAAAASWGIERVRARDRVVAIERYAASFATELVRARCEANPNWFLAGPREAAPTAAVLALPDGDVLAHRPDSTPRPVEFFAYDIEYVGQSTAAPRLPTTIRSALRGGDTAVTEPFKSDEGTGVQTVFSTGWSGPCAVLFFRMHPPPGQLAEHARIFGFLATGAFLVLMVVGWPLERRIRTVGARMRESARTEYREPAAVSGRDELSGLGFAFNEATVDLRRLQTDVRDREADLRRFVAYVANEAGAARRAHPAEAASMARREQAAG